MQRKTSAGLRVDYYERRSVGLVGPYPALITFYDTKTQLASLRVMLLDDYCTAEVKNVPNWQPDSAMPDRYWRSEQTDDIPGKSDRFSKIAKFLENNAKPVKMQKKSYVAGTDIQVRYGAFIEILDKNGQKSKQIYIPKDAKISLMIPVKSK